MLMFGATSVFSVSAEEIFTWNTNMKWSMTGAPNVSAKYTESK